RPECPFFALDLVVLNGNDFRSLHSSKGRPRRKKLLNERKRLANAVRPVFVAYHSWGPPDNRRKYINELTLEMLSASASQPMSKTVASPLRFQSVRRSTKSTRHTPSDADNSQIYPCRESPRHSIRNNLGCIPAKYSKDRLPRQVRARPSDPVRTADWP